MKNMLKVYWLKMYRLVLDVYYDTRSSAKYWKVSRIFKLSSLKRHSYILWKTWSWKSEILKNIRFNLQSNSNKRQSCSLISIEPQWKLSIELLKFYLNSEKKERVVYLDTHIRQTAKQVLWEDLFDEDYIFRLNPFDINDDSEANIEYLSDQLTSVFFSLVKSDSSDQMELLLTACINSLLHFWGCDVLDLLNFLSENRNESYIHKAKQLSNPIHVQTIEELELKYYKTTQKSIRTRIAKTISSHNTLKLLTGDSSVDISKALKKGRVLICNLRQGLLSEESSKIIGKLILAIIQTEIKKRELGKNHKPAFVFVDEAQDFITDKVTNILAKERQKGLHLLLSHQNVGQLSNLKILNGIMANTSLKLASKNDPKSQSVMAKQMNIKVKDFDTLKKYRFFINDWNSENPTTRPFKSTKKYLNTKSSPYFMDKIQLREFFLWTVHESGYYQKITPKTVRPITSTYWDPFNS